MVISYQSYIDTFKLNNMFLTGRWEWHENTVERFKID